MPTRFLRGYFSRGFATDSDHGGLGSDPGDATCQAAYTSPAAAELAGATSWTDMGLPDQIFDPAAFTGDVFFRAQLQLAYAREALNRAFWWQIYDVDNAANVHYMYHGTGYFNGQQGDYVVAWINVPAYFGTDQPASKTRLRWRYQWKYWDQQSQAYVAAPTSAYLHCISAFLSYEES